MRRRHAEGIISWCRFHCDRETNVVQEEQRTENSRQHPTVSYRSSVCCHFPQISGSVTLSAAVVHCSSEFVPGLTYVALSRVRDPANLQVLNFRPTNLLPLSSRVIRECSTDLGQIEEDLRCCRNKELCDDFFEVKDKYAIEEKDCDETFNFPSELNDRLVASSFERDDDEPMIDIVQPGVW